MANRTIAASPSASDRPLEIPPPPPLATHWRRAFRSMRELLDDPDDTAKAIDFFYAIGRREFERSFQRFAASPQGRALLAEQPDIAAALSDRAALAGMAEGSFGRAYLAFLERNGFQSMGLLQLQREVEARWDAEEGVPRLDPLRAWFRARFILSHDLFHVLTGYGTDEVGEATLLAFSLAQLGGRGQALLTFGAALETWRVLGWRWIRYDFRAWRRGRRAAWLVALPWEELLPLRLATVRRLARLADPGEAHPEGVLRGSVHDGVFTPA